MAAHGIRGLDDVSAMEWSGHRPGSSLVYVSREETLIGVIELEPTLRPEVMRVLDALRERRVELVFALGRPRGPTRALAEALGFDRYFAGYLPNEKARLIEDLQSGGRTACLVGDGINDAIALKTAAVSVSMGDASEAAMDSAQITLMDHGLELLPALFQLADDFERNVRNIKLALGAQTGIGIGGVFLAGLGPPGMTALYSMSMTSGLAIALWPHWSLKGTLNARQGILNLVQRDPKESERAT